MDPWLPRKLFASEPAEVVGLCVSQPCEEAVWLHHNCSGLWAIADFVLSFPCEIMLYIFVEHMLCACKDDCMMGDNHKPIFSSKCCMFQLFQQDPLICRNATCHDLEAIYDCPCNNMLACARGGVAARADAFDGHEELPFCGKCRVDRFR